ncbi:MAG: enolase C-terminal domain-like protein [Acidobacteriota bacterium]
MSEAKGPRIEEVRVSAYRIPTDYPEADGTIAWDSTTLVLVEIEAGGRQGLGFGYADRATAEFVRDVLSPIVKGSDAMAITGIWAEMVRQVRNHGRPGVASMAISAVDVALWDLKARLLDLPLFVLLGRVREAIPVYGSGGFTSYPNEKLKEQLGNWVSSGIGMVKMKVGTHPEEDVERVRAAKEAVGDEAELFVDANGAYSRKQALEFAETFKREFGVKWFEEPVSSDDLDGLRLMRDRAPAGMAITAGEYGYDLPYFRRMLEAGAVDVLMADGTRCGGITGFLHVDGLCQAFGLPLSAHTAPSVHAHPCCAALRAIHLEYFHDHARIEHMLFDGALTPENGLLHPDPSRAGLGLEFKRPDATPYEI